MSNTGLNKKIDDICDRIGVASEASPIAVFREPSENGYKLRSTFANTAQREIERAGSNYIGSFHKRSGEHSVREKIRQSVIWQSPKNKTGDF